MAASGKMTADLRNALVEQYLPLVKRLTMAFFAKHTIPSFVEASDVIQDVSCALINAIGQYRGDKGCKLESYLHTVISRDILDAVEKQWRRDRYGFYFEPTDQRVHTLPMFDRKLLKQHLTEKQLKAYVMVYEYGFTHERAAEKLGISRRAFSDRLYPAIAKLKKLTA